MSTKASAANLIQALKELTLEWDRTKNFWQDSKRQEFERTYVEVLPDHVMRATTVIQDVDALLRKVRSDCE